jgi:Trypsin-co-occurring domain 2
VEIGGGGAPLLRRCGIIRLKLERAWGMTEIGLQAAIAAVRQDLAAAAKEGADSDFQFPVDGVEMEFQVAATWEGETGGKIRFWVLEWGASVSGTHESVHKVKVSLGAPVNKAGDVVKVNRHEEP